MFFSASQKFSILLCHMVWLFLDANKAFVSGNHREFHPFELLDREPVTIISPLVNSLVTKNLAGIV